MDFEHQLREGSPALSPGGMLDEPIFPAFGNDASTARPESPTELQKNDPLGTQIWKLYSRAKTQLPNAERMSNLTWRMMALNMRRAEFERNNGYERRHTLRPSAPLPSLTMPPPSANPDCSVQRPASSPQSNDFMSPPPATARPPPRTAPSGIAQQLRRSADQQAQLHQPQPPPPQDTMNLDDFIFPSSVGSPAGLSPEPSNAADAPFNPGTGVPIRKANQLNDHNLSLAHASAPPVPPQITREDEFGYVPRHVRKTSIDERRVSRLSLLFVPIMSLRTPR
jgi:GATA-binding protein